jgi:hypothetical protein
MATGRGRADLEKGMLCMGQVTKGLELVGDDE